MTRFAVPASRTFLRALLAAVIATALMPATALAAGGDDDIPGAVRVSPYVDSLNRTTDPIDVIQVSVGAGEIFTAELSFPSGAWVAGELYAPGATSITSDVSVAFSVPYSATKDRLSYYSASGGTYYLALYVPTAQYWTTSTLAYTATFSSSALSGDSDIASAKSGLPGTGLADSLDWRTDPNDVWSVDLVAGQELYLTLAPQVDRDFDLTLWGPGTSTVWGGDSLTDYDWGSGTDAVRLYCPPGGDGTYYAEAFSTIDSGTYALSGTITTPNVPRVSGADRWLTSVAISKSTFASASSVVLATGTEFADALAASSLAGALDCPVLLVPGSADNAEQLLLPAAYEMERLGVGTIYVVGGESAIPSAVSTFFKDFLGSVTVKRVSSSDRYRTALAVANELFSIESTDTAFLVRGDDFADALAVAPYAFSQGIPVLLTGSSTLDSSAASFIEARNIKTVVIAGGTAAVNPGVATAVSKLNGGTTTVVRRSGANRYDTALSVANYCVNTRVWGAWDYVAVATGTTFPDALSGAAATGKRGGTLLLTEPGRLSSPAYVGIAVNDPDVAMLFGGPAALSSAVKTSVQNLMP